MLRLSTFVAAALLASLATSAQGQTAPKISCEGDLWNIQSAEQIAAHGLSERATRFYEALDEARKYDPASRAVDLYVINCPIVGLTIRTVKQFPRLDGRTMRPMPTYGVYATIALLRNTQAEDLVHEARKQSCIVVLGLADKADRPGDPYLPDDVKRNIQSCELQLAVNFDDADYAKWLARLLGVDVPRKQAMIFPRTPETNEMIKRAIQELEKLPDGRPAQQGIESLEKLRRSFEEFPPMQPK